MYVYIYLFCNSLQRRRRNKKKKLSEQMRKDNFIYRTNNKNETIRRKGRTHTQKKNHQTDKTNEKF
jgi:hypothetical protein